MLIKIQLFFSFYTFFSVVKIKIWIIIILRFLRKWSPIFPKKNSKRCVSCLFVYFSFLDEINWPEGEEAPPLDAQELVTLLLRQNPLERLGTGESPGRSIEDRPTDLRTRIDIPAPAWIRFHARVCKVTWSWGRRRSVTPRHKCYSVPQHSWTEGPDCWDTFSFFYWRNFRHSGRPPPPLPKQIKMTSSSVGAGPQMSYGTRANISASTNETTTETRGYQKEVLKFWDGHRTYDLVAILWPSGKFGSFLIFTRYGGEKKLVFKQFSQS